MVSIDKVREYWDSSPCFTRRSAAPKDSKQFMDETEARKFISEPAIPEFAEYEKWAGKKVLLYPDRVPYRGKMCDTIRVGRPKAPVEAMDDAIPF